MNIREKLPWMSDENLNKFVSFLTDFNCKGLSCCNCLFTDDDGICIYGDVIDEYLDRYTPAE